MLKSVEWRMLKRDSTLREQESPQVPIPTLSTVHMHRPNSIDPAGMHHRQVLVAEYADTPIAAKPVSINNATKPTCLSKTLATVLLSAPPPS